MKRIFLFGFLFFVSNVFAVIYTPADVAEFRKAAARGDAEAQCELGVCYEYGFGVQEDLKQAVVWYRKAAEQDMQKRNFI